MQVLLVASIHRVYSRGHFPPASSHCREREHSLELLAWVLAYTRSANKLLAHSHK